MMNKYRVTFTDGEYHPPIDLLADFYQYESGFALLYKNQDDGTALLSHLIDMRRVIAIVELPCDCEFLRDELCKAVISLVSDEAIEILVSQRSNCDCRN